MPPGSLGISGGFPFSYFWEGIFIFGASPLLTSLLAVTLLPPCLLAEWGSLGILLLCQSGYLNFMGGTAKEYIAHVSR